jgi:hypothetical protein
MVLGQKSLKISFQVCVFILRLYILYISHHLSIGQSAVDRPDLVTRVFHAKQQALLKMIRDGYFGAVAGFVYTIEYQKRGLPHMHLLIFLEEPDKINTVEQVDAIISAQIPDPAVHPQLHEAVSKYMLHGPCSPQRCIENNVCKKRFPKSFSAQTIIKEDGYPDYARPENQRIIQKHQNTFDNSHVVPHPRELLVMFNCHINLEVCGSIKAVKYIHKYIYKGPDRATMQQEGADEIRSYLDARYISSTQACHNIFEFSMHMEWPAVYRLSIHLPGEQNVVFRNDANIRDLVDNPKVTELMAWFEANRTQALIDAGAHDYLYQDFPKKFVWDKKNTVWKVRQRYKVIGRMYVVYPSAGEKFYLRLLLTQIKGKFYTIMIFQSTHISYRCNFF